MRMFDFRGYGGTPTSVPLEKVNGLSKEPTSRGCLLWVEGSETPFIVTEPYDTVRQRLGDVRLETDG